MITTENKLIISIHFCVINIMFKVQMVEAIMFIKQNQVGFKPVLLKRKKKNYAQVLWFQHLVPRSKKRNLQQGLPYSQCFCGKNKFPYQEVQTVEGGRTGNPAHWVVLEVLVPALKVKVRQKAQSNRHKHQ